MPLLSDENINGNRLTIWEITEDIPMLMASLPLSESHVLQFSLFRNDTRRLEWLAVQHLLLHQFGTVPNLTYSDHGKPSIENSPIKLSISHTKGFAALSVNQNRETGVDIEYVDIRIRNVKSRYLNDRELSYCNDNIDKLLLCWCAKEAIFKIVPHIDIEFKNEIALDISGTIGHDGHVDGTFIRDLIFEKFFLYYKIEPTFVVVCGNYQTV